MILTGFLNYNYMRLLIISSYVIVKKYGSFYSNQEKGSSPVTHGKTTKQRKQKPLLDKAANKYDKVSIQGDRKLT